MKLLSMAKFLLPAFFSLLICLDVAAQQPAAEKDTAIIDSAAILKDLMNLLDSADEATSYALITASMGNRLFSLRNNQLNTRQATTATIVYNPAAGYFHKSGFSLSAGVYLLNDAGNGCGITQYSITPAFDLPGNDKFSLGVSYTRYFVKDKFSPYASPVQDDLYASCSYNKPWIQPGIALGYSMGEYMQANSKDTVINNIRRVFYDSVTFKLKAFFIMLSASHRFTWYNIFTRKDGFELTPSLLLNCGSSTTNITHKTNAQNLLNLLARRGKLRRQLSNKFQAESLGMNINCNYAIGNFSFNPQVYFDYYLPSTTEQKFTQVFTLSLGYSF